MLWSILLFLSCQTAITTDSEVTTVEFFRTTAHSRGIRHAVSSSVVIGCFKEGEFVSKGSGNYLKVGGKKFILTANHVTNDCDEIQLKNRLTSAVTAEVIHADEKRDVAVLRPEQELYDVEAIEYQPRDPDLGERVYFMGHPDEIEFFLFEGLVSLDAARDFFLHSTGWGGVSGAVVFSRTGRVFGVTKAVKVTFSPATGFPRLLEDMVLVSKVNYLTRDKIRELMDGEK
jgi:S1-C subfamily serine protease